MVIYLKPYHADASMVRRVYPVTPFHDIVAARAQHANMAMYRAYAATKTSDSKLNVVDLNVDCSKADDCQCCMQKGLTSYKGPQGTIIGDPCSKAEAAYTKKFGQCQPPAELKGRGSTLQEQKKTVEDIGKGKQPGHKGKSGKEPQHAKTKVSGAGTTHTKTEGTDTSGTDTPDTSTDTTATPPAEDTTTTTPAPAGLPSDLFASIPQVSQFFNSIYTKVCSSGTKIPFICTSLAYFEIAVIVAVVLLIVVLTSGGRRRRR